MYILNQDRDEIVVLHELIIEDKERNAEVQVLSADGDFVTVGIYVDINRAKEILMDVFDSIQRDQKWFIMPKE